MSPLRTTLLTALAGLTLILTAAPASAATGGGWSPDEELAEPQPRLTVSDAIAYEADGAITFSLELDHAATDDIDFDFSIVHAGTDVDDFAPSLVNKTISKGESSATVSLGLVGDDGVEGAEDFYFELDDIPGIAIVNQQAEGRILDGDGPQLHLHNDEAPEGDAGGGGTIPVTVTASYAPLEDISFRLYSGIFGFEAEPDVDFVPLDEIVTLPAGETSVVTHVQIIGDAEVEDDELLPIYAGAPTTGTFGIEGSAELRILDDDVDSPPPGNGAGQPVPPFKHQNVHDAPGDGRSAGASGGDAATTTTTDRSPDHSGIGGDTTAGQRAASVRGDDGVSPLRAVAGLLLILALLAGATVAYRASRRADAAPSR